MTYATRDQLVSRFTEGLLLRLTDRSKPPLGAINDAIVAQELKNADAEIDGYLAGKYRLPLASVPPQVVDLAQVIAIYKLHPFKPDEKITKDYEFAQKRLKDIASGAFKLPLEGVEPPANEGSGVITNDRQRPFSEENMRGYI